MALSKHPKDKNKLFLCPLCSETLQSPRILPCLHTFCERCIHGFILSVKTTKEGNLVDFACPVCRTVVKPPKDTEKEKWSSCLPKNVTISAMINVANSKRQDCHACQRHNQQSEAMFWCKDCDEALCEKCHSMHSWFKVLSAHSVYPIEDIESISCGIETAGIREECSIHPSKKLEGYCLDHETLCCIRCMTLAHNNCKFVTDIGEMPESFKNTMQKIVDIKEATEQLLKLKLQQISDFKMNVENIEEEAEKFTDLMKRKLDELFQTFTKQLHVFRDEHLTDMNIQIRLLEQIVNSLQHWVDTTKVVEDNGSKTQLFVHVMTLKTQIKKGVGELATSSRQDRLVSLNFERNRILQQVNALETIGEFITSTENIADQLHSINTSCKAFGIQTFPTFDDISVKKMKSFYRRNSNLTSGLCIDNDVLLLADESETNNLQLFSMQTRELIGSMQCTGTVKRLCYSEVSKQIFISCTDSELYTAGLEEKQIVEPQETMFNDDDVGDLCLHDGHVYIIVDGGIKKFPHDAKPETTDQMTLCFETNTECGLNGIDIYNSNIVYTTEDNEIKCTTLNGDIVFCYKHEEIETPECLTVLSSGLMLVVDRADNGSLHVLSADGTKHRQLLSHFDDIKDPRDIWLDNDEENIYIVGGEYIEVFSII